MCLLDRHTQAYFPKQNWAEIDLWSAYALLTRAILGNFVTCLAPYALPYILFCLQSYWYTFRRILAKWQDIGCMAAHPLCAATYKMHVQLLNPNWLGALCHRHCFCWLFLSCFWYATMPLNVANVRIAFDTDVGLVYALFFHAHSNGNHRTHTHTRAREIWHSKCIDS